MTNTNLEEEVSSENRVSLNGNEYDSSKMDSEVLKYVIESHADYNSAVGGWERNWREKKNPCRVFWP